MTGYGLSTLETDVFSLRVEAKTLNSKFLDVNFKLPKIYSEKELELRRMIGDHLERGKVSVQVEFYKKSDDNIKLNIDKELFKEYFYQLQVLAVEVGAPSVNELFKLALQSPDVQKNNLFDAYTEDIPVDWNDLVPIIEDAIIACDKFRMQEGEVLKTNLEEDIRQIKALLEEVIIHAPRRAEAVRQRLTDHVKQYNMTEQIDENRFEQELIFYIEKLDINEEKVRLASHLDYFIEVINEEKSQGKKLGFISQEIGREINTIGSKANDATIQKLVIGMKEALEKVKEQLLNIL